MKEIPVHKTKIKMCGITNLADARYAAGARADYIGFIFHETSPRYITPAEVGAIINWIDGPQKVGVFMDHALDDVIQIVKETGLDMVQLHGNESPEYCRLIEVPVIKTIHVTPETTSGELQNTIKKYENVIGYFLFDTKINGLSGGTGKTFDWDMLSEWTKDIPFFLSGGLSPENINEAIYRVKPSAVDMCSSLEEKPGIKDYDKIDAVMEKLKAF